MQRESNVNPNVVYNFLSLKIEKNSVNFCTELSEPSEISGLLQIAQSKDFQSFCKPENQIKIEQPTTKPMKSAYF